MGGWRYEIFGCFSTPLTSLWACFIPFGIPCLQATTAKLVVTTAAKENQAAIACILATCLCCFGTAYNRTKIRDNLRVEGSYLVDLVIMCLLPCCGVVQEWREVMNNKGLSEDSPVWRAWKGYQDIP